MMKTVGLSLSYIILLGIIAQLSSIFSLKIWGSYSDKYSNKTIMAICAPVYIGCILAWSFTGMHSMQTFSIVLLVVIHVLTGITTAGFNLAIENLALKLSPGDESIAYISARNIVVAFFSAIAPIIGGMMADFFANRHLEWAIQWQGPKGISKIPLLELQNWNFFFVIGAILAMFSLRAVKNLKEDGEVEKKHVVKLMKKQFKRTLRKSNPVGIIRYRMNNPVLIPAIKRKMMTYFQKQAA
jgi:MFS family permease